jgi:hypothetical protein
VGVWLVRSAVLPATIRDAHLTKVSGDEPCYASLSWRYGPGARPVSIIFDLETCKATGSVTTDGEESEATIPLASAPCSTYHLTVSATYRLLGFAHTMVTRTRHSLV